MTGLLNDFIKYAEQERLVINYVQVRKEGKIAADYQRLNSKIRLNTWSACKSFVSIAAGIAMEEKLISSDEKIAFSFEEYLPKHPCENLLNITVKDLLTMTSGLEKALFFADDAERYVTEDWIEYFFRQNFANKPGSRFLYSNFNTYMLSCLIEKKAGENLLEYLRHRLFSPLKIYSPDWTFCPKGHVHAANGLYLTIDEMANFGEMLLRNGEFNNIRVVSADYIEEATSNRLSLVEPKDGYGYQFWINPDHKSYRAAGKFGQFIIAVPEKEAVVAVQALESKDIFPAVWEYIIQKI